ncbi:MAG: family 43 glycosylhydrolase, partial [Phocaeicola sp.]
MKKLLLIALCAVLLCGCKANKSPIVHLNNPIIPGYFADPTIVELDGTYYVYVTADPWGTGFLSCWETTDFKNWKFNKLNWPTADQCVSPLQNGDKVWAPAVIKRGEKYYMYTSVGSEIWVGESNAPLGPWKNMLGDRPMIEADTTRYCHIIDADIFADDDGNYYLYWGSGFDWVDGKCFMAQLADDMCSFVTEPKEVTPTGYFEAPFMVKNNGKYYMMYSDGMTIRDTYKVRYAVGDSPFGPFTEAANSPILVTNKELEVYGPGHHCVTEIGGEHYIFYHKHRLPYIENTAYRQTCVDKLVFTPNGEIATITPSLQTTLPLAEAKLPCLLEVKSVTSSSVRDSYTEAV